jgi:hypothetical protein
MNILDEYRRYARECQHMADKTQNSADRALWQRLAARWLAKLKNPLESLTVQEVNGRDGTASKVTGVKPRKRA